MFLDCSSTVPLLAGSTPVSTDYFVYGSASNGVINGSIQATNRAFGLLTRAIRAYNSPDAATNDLCYNGQGLVTNTVQYTGTGDPAISNSLFYNERNELVQRTDAGGRAYTFTFDDMGRPTGRETFDTGQAVPLDWEYRYYNDNGELNWIDGPRYNPEDYIYYDYDGAGRRTQEIRWQSQGNRDGSGVSAVPGYGQYATTFWQYDTLGNPTNIVDPLGNYVVQSFDAVGELVRQVYYASNGAALATSGFAYEPGGLVSAHTNALGGVTLKSYTTTGKLKQQINPDGSTIAWAFDLSGRPVTQALPNGNYWQTTYNDAQRSVTKTFHNATTTLATNLTQLDRRGNVMQYTDALGNVSTNRFDGLDRLKIAAGPPIVTVSLSMDLTTHTTNIAQQISTYVYDNCGQVLTVSNALGERTVTTSDPLGRPLQVAYYNANGATPVRLVSTYYSPDHQSVTVTNGTGANAIVTTTYTDTAGRPVLTLHYPTNGVIEYTWQQFDANGNRLAAQQLSSSGGVITTWATNGWTYDGLNRVVTETTKDGALTTFSVDALGDVTNRVMPGGLSWGATYLNDGRIASEQERGAGLTARSTTYAYYSSGSPFAGRLQTVTDGRNTTRSNAYDDFLRLASITTTGSAPEQQTATSYSYDLDHRLTAVNQTFNSTNTGPNTSVSRHYSPFGLLAEEEVTDSNWYFARCTPQWDVAGRRTGLEINQDYWNTTSIGFGYRADGLMTAAGGSSGGGATFGYADSGLLMGRTNGLRTWFVNQRDGEGRLLQSTTKVGNQTVLQENLSWRNDGRLSAYTAARADFTDARNYAYSVLASRLTQESFAVAAGQRLTNSYTLDRASSGGLGVLTAATESGASAVSWAVPGTGGLDGLSRVVQAQDSSLSRPTFGLATGAGTVSATLDSKPVAVQFDGPRGGQWRAQMDLTSGSHTLQVSAVDPSGLYFASATNTFTVASNALDTIQNQFDGNGNVTHRVWVNSLGQTNRTQTLTWDAFNRLTAVTDRDALTNGFNWSAVYDGLGRRLSTVCTMVLSNTPVSIPAEFSEVDSIYDPQIEFLEVGVTVNGEFSMKTYGPDANGVYGGMQGVGGLEAIDTSGHSAATGVVQDYFGNVIGTIANGAVSWNPARFSSYGPVPGYQQSTLSLNTPLAQSLGYRGKRVDETGLIYLGARLYDPVAGRFISADPLGHTASQDLYSFCSGDPVNQFDPDGRCIDQGMQAVDNWASSKYQNAVSAWGAFSNPETREQASLDYTYGQAQGAVQWTTETLGVLAKAIRGNPMEDYFDQLNPSPSVSALVNGWMDSTASGYGINPNSASAQTGNFGSQAGLTVASLLAGPGEARAGSEVERLLPSVEQMAAARSTTLGETTYDVSFGSTGSGLLDSLGLQGARISNIGVKIDPSLTGADLLNVSAHESFHVAVAQNFPNFAASSGRLPFIGAFPLYAEEVGAYGFGAASAGQYGQALLAPVSAFQSLKVGQSISVLGTGGAVGGLWYYNTH